jgi:alpha-galactosidase
MAAWFIIGVFEMAYSVFKGADLVGLKVADPGTADTVDGVIGGSSSELFRALYRSRLSYLSLLLLFLISTRGVALFGLGASSGGPKPLAATPPMGWNTWAHYQCGYTAQTILANARALVSTGLAARGYDTVTIDDCWMQKDRDVAGNLQVSRQRFPLGMEPVARAIHALGLKFGIYEDAGYATCQRFAGSGRPKGGGQDHFAQDTRLFESWGVDYLKLDGCNVYVPKDSSKDAAYRRAYAAESAILRSAGRPVVFEEAAPAFFQVTPGWYDVLTWVREYGQLWGEGTAMSTFDANRPGLPRFDSVLWNYSYNLPLGRFQKPGKWDHPDFIIAGDTGLSLAESRSQMALWSMMSAPLILSVDLGKLSSQAISILGNRAVIAVDQDSRGRMATLVQRGRAVDILFKPLAAGDDAVAILNRGAAPVRVNLHPANFGFAANSGCRLDAMNLWTGRWRAGVPALEAEVAVHDTVIWRVRASAPCGKPTRTGAIVITNNTRRPDRFPGIEGYTRCLAAAGSVEPCTGDAAESWTIIPGGFLRSSIGLCLADARGKPAMQRCRPVRAQRWQYTLKGNLISDARHQCLSADWPNSMSQDLQMQPCGDNRPNQIWSLPN